MIPAEVLEVDKNSAAAEAGLQNGDIITEYDGYHVDLAKDLYVYMYLNDLKEGDTVTLKVRRDGRTETISYTPDVSVRYLLGFNRSDASSMTVESLIDGMPLQEAGLQPGDTITAINGVEIADGEAYDAYLAEHPLSSESVEITYDRDGLDYTATITPKEYRTPQLGFSYNLGYTKTSGPADTEIRCTGNKIYDQDDSAESERTGYGTAWIPESQRPGRCRRCDWYNL